MKKKKELFSEISYKDPYLNYDLKFKLIEIDKVSVISHQRKPSNYHIKHLINSIERIGFIVPVIVIEKNENYIIIDGQHRYLAAKSLGIREIPAIVVPGKIAKLMINLNIEKELNIREKSYVSIAIYREYLENEPEILESDEELVDSLEQAYYVTLGLAYEKFDKLSGSSFESILKKCDYFLDEKIKEALKIREKRSEKILEANLLVKEITEKLKDRGKWHPYLNQQILSYCNPYKRKKLPMDFNELFETLIDNLNRTINNPEVVLRQEII
jgi:ParB family transcriptional regulator, chromosome partitioning protein